MKRLGDYQNEEAIELWADLLEPISAILGDKEIAAAYRSGISQMQFAGVILRTHAKEAKEILLRIDPTPLNGLNIVVRIVDVIMELKDSDEIKGFFESAGQEKTESVSSGLHMVSTEVAEA